MLASRLASSTARLATRPYSQRTAALVVAGNEILNGGVQDTNTQTLAKAFYERGVALERVVVVLDDIDTIAAEVRDASAKYDYVLTSGGIGPTHDDVTYEAVAKAFGLSLALDEPTVALMRSMMKKGPLNEARLRMATLPTPAEYLRSDGLWVPLVKAKNCYMLPGVPWLFEKMLNAHIDQFVGGTRLHKREVLTHRMEGDIAHILTDFQERHQHIVIGSYPRVSSSGPAPDDQAPPYRVRIVLEGADKDELDRMAHEMATQFADARL